MPDEIIRIDLRQFQDAAKGADLNLFVQWDNCSDLSFRGLFGETHMAARLPAYRETVFF